MYKQHGFSAIILILLLTLLASVGAIGWYVINKDNNNNQNIQIDTNQVVEEESIIEESTEEDKSDVKINSFEECIDAGYIEYSSIDGPAFCKSPDGTKHYQ